MEKDLEDLGRGTVGSSNETAPSLAPTSVAPVEEFDRAILASLETAPPLVELEANVGESVAPAADSASAEGNPFTAALWSELDAAINCFLFAKGRPELIDCLKALGFTCAK